jgi:hypothetical protein
MYASITTQMSAHNATVYTNHVCPMCICHAYVVQPIIPSIVYTPLVENVHIIDCKLHISCTKVVRCDSVSSLADQYNATLIILYSYMCY